MGVCVGSESLSARSLPGTGSRAPAARLPAQRAGGQGEGSFRLIRAVCFSCLPEAPLNYVAVRDDVGLKNSAFQLLNLHLYCLRSEMRSAGVHWPPGNWKRLLCI